MVRLPVAGRVKTRLARGAGVVAATAFYRRATRSLLARIDHPARWTTILALTPDPDAATTVYPAHLPRLAQGAGDLGHRLQRLMERLPPGPVVVIGSDAPGVTATQIAKAFQRIGDADAVIGPSGDGGYWAIGLRRRPHVPRVFAGIRWSTAQALNDTMRAMGTLKVAVIDELDDVDTADDLERVGRLAGRRVVKR